MVSLMCTLEHHRDEVNCCDFSPTLLATCSGDKTIRLYDTNDFSELPFSPLSGHGYGVHCCRFSSCGGYLVTCSTDASIMIWSSATGEVLGTLEHPGRSPVRACALAPDSAQLLSGACDGTVAIWDFSSKTLNRCIAVSEASVVACCFTPCGQMFVTGCTYGAIKLWDIHGDLVHSERDAHDLGVTGCNFAHQYKSDGCMEFRLASCGQDSLLKIWIVSQRGGTACEMTLLHTLTGQSAPVLSCAFSWDGEMVVSGSVDKTIAVYDANLGALLHTLNEHDRYVTAVALSPSMTWIATGSMDKTVKVWRTGDGDGAIVAEPRQQPTCCKGRKPPGYSRLLLDDWTEEDVGTWLHEEGLEELVSVFKVNNIDGPELSQLNKDILASELGIGVTADIMKALFHSGRHVGSLETLCYTSGSQSVLEWVPLPNGPRTESVGLRGRLLRKIEALKAEQNGSEAPDEFVCPITRELMKDPVIAADGYSYEKEAIESWIKAKNRSSPMTNLPLQTTLVIPNRSLKIAIRRWKSSQKM